ncbi:hypothetical protein K504DRAFT_449781 [Pleomassaria siparia CBS 279.74]|uniref:Uncharacterized protein n=1 Tax=Pleomassaria siparia CBS 279.74 TaxID=1314801 RepID=A0A6G1KKK0_9PLEO|nr:hypothetical protein K504DRAFT_449781 [Pleomassaria siparia CBS 279.74]
MCYTHDDITRMEEEARNEDANSMDRVNKFMERFRELKDRCPTCQEHADPVERSQRLFQCHERVPQPRTGRSGRPSQPVRSSKPPSPTRLAHRQPELRRHSPYAKLPSSHAGPATPSNLPTIDCLTQSAWSPTPVPPSFTFSARGQPDWLKTIDNPDTSPSRRTPPSASASSSKHNV